MRRSTSTGRAKAAAVAAGFALTAAPAGAFDFFWFPTGDPVGWFELEQPAGFSGWTLSGGGVTFQAPDDVTDRAFLSASAKTTTLATSVNLDSVVISGGNARLLFSGGTLTTVNGFTIQTGSAELAFQGSAAVNNSAAQLVNLGTVRVISGTGSISSDVATSGTFEVGGGGTLNLNRNNADFTQTGGAFNVLSGGTANFSGNGHDINFDAGALTNDGTLAFSSGTTLNLDGAAVTNRGGITANTGSTVTLSAGSLDNSDPGAAVNVNAGTFTHDGGSITGNAIRLNNASVLNLNVPVGASSSGLGNPSFLFTSANTTLNGDIHSAITVTVGDGNGSDIVGTSGTFENRGNLVLAGVNSGFSGVNLQSGGGIVNRGTVRAAFGASGTQDRRINSNSGGLFDNQPGGQLVVEPGVQLTADMDLTNHGSVDVGTGGSLTFGSNDRLDLEAGTLTNNGTVSFTGSSGPSVFRYAGGTILGNPIEFNTAQLELDTNLGVATFHFLSGNNDLSTTSPGDIGSLQAVVVDADTGNTTLRRGTTFNGDFSFTNSGTIRLTGAAPNGTAALAVNGNSTTMTHTGTIHAQGVAGSSNNRVLTGSSGATVFATSTSDITVDPDTRLEVNVAITNGGDVTVGSGGTFDSDSPNGNAAFTHNGGTLNNQGTFITDDFTFNGGTILGNPIDVHESRLTLGAGTGPAAFILRRGNLTGNINPGQAVEVRNDSTNTSISETPAAFTNNGTLVLGGDGTGGNFLRVGPLFANLTLTNNEVFRSRNDDPLGNGGGRQLNGVLDNRDRVVVEANTTFAAIGVDNHGSFTVDPGGTFNLGSGQIFDQEAGAVVNNGDFNVGGGIFNFNGGDVTGGPVQFSGGTLVMGPNSGGGDFVLTFGNAGMAFGGTINPGADVRFVAAPSGSRIVNQGAAPGNVTVRGTLTIDETPGGTIDLRTLDEHLIDTNGRLEGSGAFTYQVFPGTLRNRGTIAPGLDPQDPTGQFSVGGAFVQEATGTLELDLGGTAPGDFDRVIASRAVTLDGTLELALTSGYTPQLGDTLDIVTGNSRAGTFAFVTQPAGMPAGLAFGVNYLPTLVQLEVIAGVLTGDYNNSGLVEQGDLNLVLQNWGLPFGAIPAGWINQRPTDGIVDQAELNSVLFGWGDTLAPDFGGASVPEPAVGLALLGLPAALRRRR